MTQSSVGPTTWRASGALARYLRVRVGAGGTLEAAAIDSSDEVGTLREPALAAGQAVSVEGNYQGQTKRYVADGAITVGALVYTAGAGKVSATNGVGSRVVGICKAAAADDGAECEVSHQLADI